MRLDKAGHNKKRAAIYHNIRIRCGSAHVRNAAPLEPNVGTQYLAVVVLCEHKTVFEQY
jgi:hypothetical protein